MRRPEPVRVGLAPPSQLPSYDCVMTLTTGADGISPGVPSVRRDGDCRGPGTHDVHMSPLPPPRLERLVIQGPGTGIPRTAPRSNDFVHVPRMSEIYPLNRPFRRAAGGLADEEGGGAPVGDAARSLSTTRDPTAASDRVRRVDVAVTDDDFDNTGLSTAAVHTYRLAVVEAVQMTVLACSGAGVGYRRGSVDTFPKPSAQDEVVGVPEEVLVELTRQ